MRMIKIGNAQAFWGDDPDAPATLLEQQPDLDYLTLDYLSEVSMSIMAVQRAKDPTAGYAKDFVQVVKSLIPYWQAGSKVKVIANAGGLEPRKCALACAEVLQQNGCGWLKIGIVYGDNVIEAIKRDPENPLFNNLETGFSVTSLINQLETANAYLGARPLVAALSQGVDIVITGRVADPSLTVAPCAFHFGWEWDDYQKIAQATVAGHLIECGTQVTGGISTNWWEIPSNKRLGFPVVEMSEDGNFVITKPTKAGGQVNIETVKEQLLYEIGDPSSYLSPDVTLSFLSLKLNELEKDRISVTGAIGKPPPSTYKVSCTYKDGFKAEAWLAITGKEATKKAYRCGEIVIERVQAAGYQLARTCIECIGNGDIVPSPAFRPLNAPKECMLRICVADKRLEAMECFSRQIAPLVTSGPQGITGYTSGRPHIRPIFGYWPCLIEASALIPVVECFDIMEKS